MLPFVAYRVSSGPELELVPATSGRVWMTETRDSFANRCLPLLMANQAGWFVLGGHTLRARWNGGPAAADIEISHEEGEPPYSASSHFGHGIVTFTLPYLFQTPPGWNLLARGPANLPKDGATALEGLVETDWCPATFTMNWQLTRAGHDVRFERGEPIAMLVPARRGELESFDPQTRAIADVPELAQSYRSWHMSRTTFLHELPQPGSSAETAGWQKDYVLGRTPDGSPAPEHQRKLILRPFRTR